MTSISVQYGKLLDAEKESKFAQCKVTRDQEKVWVLTPKTWFSFAHDTTADLIELWRHVKIFSLPHPKMSSDMPSYAALSEWVKGLIKGSKCHAGETAKKKRHVTRHIWVWWRDKFLMCCHSLVRSVVAKWVSYKLIVL